MSEIPAAHCCRRMHGQAFGEGDARVFGGIEQAEELRFLGVVGAGRIARCRTDALVGFGDQLIVLEILIG